MIWEAGIRIRNKKLPVRVSNFVGLLLADSRRPAPVQAAAPGLQR